MTPSERLAYIDKVLSACKDAWPVLMVEVDSKIGALTEQLISSDNEQTRGRIKALCDLKELPVSLAQERDGIRAALSEEDAAD